MKKIFLLGFALVLSNTVFGQSKKEKQELIAEINAFKTTIVMDIPYDVPKRKIWDAAYIMMRKEYTEIRKQDFEKGIIEGYAEGEGFREKLTVEIIGSGPYRLAFSMASQLRYQNPNGTYTGWYDNNELPAEYSYKIQLNIYNTIFGTLTYPEPLMDKINKYNASQKKEKFKLVYGVDY